MNLSLGEKISLLRNRKGYSKKRLGELIDIHWTNISKYENNKILPSVDALRKLAQVFEVSADFLLFDNAEMNFVFNDKELFEQFKSVDLLSDEQRSLVKAMISAAIRNK